MRRAVIHPGNQRGHVPLAELGQPVGHPPQRVLAGIALEVVGVGTGLFPVESEREPGPKVRGRRQRVCVLERQQPEEQAGLHVGAATDRSGLGQHGVKALGPPRRHVVGVDVEARERRRREPVALVHLRLAAAAGHPGPAVELELAGRVVAAVTDHAARIEDPLRAGPRGLRLGPTERRLRHGARCRQRAGGGHAAGLQHGQSEQDVAELRTGDEGGFFGQGRRGWLRFSCHALAGRAPLGPRWHLRPTWRRRRGASVETVSLLSH